MIVDASAIVAMLAREPEADALALRLRRTIRRITHGVSVYEATVAVARITGSDAKTAAMVVGAFLSDLAFDVAPIGAPETSAALDAFSRYGKGNHPARLNIGDCFSYAVAKLRGMPLLYKGDDFAQTDLATADLA